MAEMVLARMRKKREEKRNRPSAEGGGFLDREGDTSRKQISALQ